MSRLMSSWMLLAVAWCAAPARAEAQDLPPFERRVRERYEANRAALIANREALRVASDRDERIRLGSELQGTNAQYVADMLALAQAEPGAKAVPLALGEVIGARDSHPELMPALEQLRRDWLREPEVGAACSGLYICDAPPAEDLLRDILGRNPDRKARGLACFWLAERLDRVANLPDGRGRIVMPRAVMERKFSPEDLDAIRRRGPEMRRESRALYERAAREFADVSIDYQPSGQPDRLVGPIASRRLAMPDPAR